MNPPESITSIAARSRFDHLHITGTQSKGRYGSVYEAHVGQGGPRTDVVVRVLDTPDESDERAQFREEIADVVDRWSAVSDRERLVSVLDYGLDPTPWIATPALTGRLAARSPMDFVDPLSVARDLVEAVGTLHQKDITHGGLDPKSVVFAGDSFDGVVQGTPLLDNVGLFDAYRYRFDPSEYLDPRYAAPEHYSREYGEIDHTTDIYLLGATLYRLLTGDPPFEGSFEQIRDGVLNREPSPPAAVGAPSQIDTVISKAMAKEKLQRYETVEYLHQDLANIAVHREYE